MSKACKKITEKPKPKSKKGTGSEVLRVSFAWPMSCLSLSCVSRQRASFGKNSVKINEFEEGMGQHS